MRLKLSIITMSWHNAVTIDLIRHAVRRDIFPSRGRLWLVRNCKSLPPLIRHGLRHATFPQGKAILRRVGTLLRHPTVHPLNHGVAVTAPPTRREPFLCLNSAKTPEGVLRCWCIF